MTGRGQTSECVELDGCCQTHSPCFSADTTYVDGVTVCPGWPCPASADASTPQDAS